MTFTGDGWFQISGFSRNTHDRGNPVKMVELVGGGGHDRLGAEVDDGDSYSP